VFALAQTQTLELLQGDDVLARCRAGDEAAWKTLYDRHFDFAFRVARRLGSPSADAEDAVHEAFVIALRRLDAFTHGVFAHWLYRIVANVVSARRRRTRLRGIFHALWSHQDEATAPSPESSVGARHHLAHVEAVLAALAQKKREVFVLHELEGLSHEDIAQMIGANVQTVRTRLHYARKDFEAIARKRGVMP
jgi:RNA polymerase sigma-70 factor (ECF subfamily)